MGDHITLQIARYLPEKQVAARYGVHVVSLARLDKDPKLGFPPPIRIRGRKYRDQDELDAFDASRRERNGRTEES